MQREHPHQRLPSKICQFLKETSLGLRSCWLLMASLIFPVTSSSWGFTAHRHIVDVAIAWLPLQLQPFFKYHRSWLIEHALDADLRKHTISDEKPRHYIDLDRYGPPDSLGCVFPVSWSVAVDHWSEDSLMAHGIGPWHAQQVYKRLIHAFELRDSLAILRHAVDLAHYIADLNVPLHTTSNYNGQETGQKGIHSLWETQIPEQHQQTFHLVPMRDSLQCVYLVDMERQIWSTVLNSHSQLPSVFQCENEVRKQLEGQAIDQYIVRGRARQLMRSPEFVDAYHELLDGQVQNQMQQSIQVISSAWYSAWIDAGQPPLPTINRSNSTHWKKALDWLLR